LERDRSSKAVLGRIQRGLDSGLAPGALVLGIPARSGVAWEARDDEHGFGDDLGDLIDDLLRA
jgi:hypothetical protein